jgi:hypothetical protein
VFQGFLALLTPIPARTKPLGFLILMADREYQFIAACMGRDGFSGRHLTVPSILRLLAASFTLEAAHGEDAGMSGLLTDQ